MNEVLSQIEKTGIVPVVVLKNAKDAAPLAQSLLEGGLPEQAQQIQVFPGPWEHRRQAPCRLKQPKPLPCIHQEYQ